MNDHTPKLSDHEQLMSQLPWLANGTLDEKEESLLRVHLKECPLCRDEYASLSTMFELMDEESEQGASTAMDARSSLAVMQDRINEESQKQTKSLLYRFQTLVNSFLGSTGRPIVALASVSVLVLSLLVIQHYVQNPEVAAEYQVLSSQVQSTEIKFEVTFDEDLSMLQSTDLLTDIGQQVGLKTRFLSKNQDKLIFATTGETSELNELPQHISKMMELIKKRSEVVDVQLVP